MDSCPLILPKIKKERRIFRIILRRHFFTICPEIGRKMEAIAELLANSVVNDVRKLIKNIISQTGS